MKVFLQLTICIVCIFAVVFGQRAPKPIAPKPTPTAPKPQSDQPQKPPTINWGKCPQLQPTESENTRKDTVRDTCLKAHPIPKERNERTFIAHSKLMTECGLKQENWFDRRGRYRFSRTKARITSKKLPKPIETQIVSHVDKCRADAQKQFPNKQQMMDSIQLFQACMDFQTTQTCEIKITQN